MQTKTIGKCSLCGGRVVVPAGPIGYAGNIEDLTRCSSCGARPSAGPTIDMEPVSNDDVLPSLKKVQDGIRRADELLRKYGAK
jgi:hypothetical protein